MVVVNSSGSRKEEEEEKILLCTQDATLGKTPFRLGIWGD